MKWHKFLENFLKKGNPEFPAQGPVAPELLPWVLLRMLLGAAGRPVIVLFPAAAEAENAGAVLEELLKELNLPAFRILHLPEAGRGKLLFPGVESRRARALDKILRGDYDLLCGSVSAFTGAAPPAAESDSGRMELKAGMTLPPAELLAKLVKLDYDDEYETTVPGEFSRRGGIVDLYSPAHDFPCRVEYFGDEIDTLRRFSPETQRSVEKIESYQIIGRAGITAGGPAESDAIAYFEERDYNLVVCNPDQCGALLRRYAPPAQLSRFEQLLGRCNRKNREFDLYTPSPELPPELPVPGIDPVFDDNAKFSKKQGSEAETFHLNALRELMHRMEGSGGMTLVASKSEQGAAALKLWCRKHQLNSAGTEFSSGVFRSGFLIPEQNFLLLTEKELLECGFTRELDAVSSDEPVKANEEESGTPVPEFSLADIDEGDLAVHLDHGIGIFRGFKVLESGGVAREVIVMEYRDGQILYVPLLSAHKLSRYLGAVGQVKLHALNSGRWQKDCQKAGAGVRSYAADMLRLQAMRNSIAGLAMKPEPEAEKLFLQDFPFQDTPDQKRGTAEIWSDQAAPKPMDRLLCGDVGYGKTELAMRAAFRAVSAGRQVAVIAPTTVLVQQHFDSFCARFAKYPFTIAQLSRFRPDNEQEHTIAQLASGGVDIVIGTHRLCRSKVKFRNLGLVIIDEEQRFGVRIKEYLRRARAEADVLSMSATPIPRTLYLAMAGARDLTTLMTPPKQRMPVKTVIAPAEPKLIGEAIAQELARGGQIYYLHNRVKTMQETLTALKALVPECRFACAHGQMPEGELEEVMRDFLLHRIDCLICSTIIESGLDVPNANTILVERSDRFGLGELYQLRGRVGRWKNQAYAYMLLPKNTMIGSNARKRLAAIRRCSTLGAGFQLALHDLEIRGAGNILGAEQSGHLNSIGFDLYCQLLKQEVGRLSGKDTVLLPEVDMAIDFVSFALRAPKEVFCCGLSPQYIDCDRLRFDLYRRLGNFESEAQIDDFRNELTDRFGKLPKEAENLLAAVRIRLLAALADYRQLSVVNGRVTLCNPGGTIYRLSNGMAPHIDYRDPPELRMVHLTHIVRQAAGLE